MNDDGSMTIGTFARATGVTVSALRFYDECGLVRPDAVDPSTGYRHYSVRQLAEVALIRHLRDAGMPLADVRRVLAAPADEAEDVVRAHLRGLEERLAAARSGARAALALVHRRDRAVTAGRALATAVGQVAPAALARGEPRVLTGVLVEVRDGELTLVATDRYRLAVRSLPLPAPGAPLAVVVPAREFDDLSAWLAAQDDVGLGVTGDGLALDGTDGRSTLPRVEGAFPDHRLLLAGLPAPVTRIVASRDDLLAALGEDPAARTCLRAGSGGLDVRPVAATEPALVAAEVVGPPVTVGFVVGTVRPAVRAAVGPDVLLQISAADLPVVVRSADDGSLTSLAMPTRLDPEGAASPCPARPTR